MTKNYKSPARKPAKPSSAPKSTGLVWFLSGLILGAVGASSYFMSKPFQIWAAKLIQSSTDASQLATNQEASEPEAEPAGKEPQFDFYTILPEMEVSVPEKDIPTKPGEPSPASDDKKQYVLQAGSFGDLEQADRQKALLAMLGIEAKIQTLSVEGGKTWHRLLIGPFGDAAQLEITRQTLLQNKINTITLELKKG